MAATKYVYGYEATFKLHSGQTTEKYFITAANIDNAFKSLVKTVAKRSHQLDGVMLGCALLSREAVFSPLLPATDVAN